MLERAGHAGPDQSLRAAVTALFARDAPAALLADRDAFTAACWDMRFVRDRHPLIREGAPVEHAIFVVDGWGARAKHHANGDRQITAFALSGDLLLEPGAEGGTRILDHHIVALTPLHVALIPYRAITALARDRPALRALFAWSYASDLGRLRAWLTRNGRRAATSRVAHLLCELHARREPRDSGTASFPLTQAEIADAVGLTPVHVSRVMKELRAARLVHVAQRRIEITDLAGLTSLGRFDHRYAF